MSVTSGFGPPSIRSGGPKTPLVSAAPVVSVPRPSSTLRLPSTVGKRPSIKSLLATVNPLVLVTELTNGRDAGDVVAKPPPLAAELPLTVQFVSVAVPRLYRPPPLPAVV